MVPVGGAGLIAGVALAVKEAHPHVQVVGVESTHTGNFAAAVTSGTFTTAPTISSVSGSGTTAR